MIIAVIPAKSKSRRLPGKNMKELLGKPLIDYTIEYAQGCDLIDEIYVSTDSEKIAQHAYKKGVKVVMRPSELCGDTPIVEVLKHCIRNIPEADKIIHVVALQVDNPDRNTNLTNLLHQSIDKDVADTITIGSDGVRNGSVRILRKEDLMADKISYGIIAVQDNCTNIHTHSDFKKACKRLE